MGEGEIFKISSDFDGKILKWVQITHRRNLGLSERQWEAMEEGEREVLFKSMIFVDSNDGERKIVKNVQKW